MRLRKIISVTLIAEGKLQNDTNAMHHRSTHLIQQCNNSVGEDATLEAARWDESIFHEELPVDYRETSEE